MNVEGFLEKLTPVREAFEASSNLTGSRLCFKAKVIAIQSSLAARVGEFQNTRGEVDYLHLDLVQRGDSVEGGTSVTILASSSGQVILTVEGDSTQFGSVRRVFAETLLSEFAQELRGWEIKLPVTDEVSDFTTWKL